MLVIMCISDEVEETLASWVEPLFHVIVTSFRLEEQERGTFAPSTTDFDPLGLSVGGLKTKKKCKTLYFTELLYLLLSDNCQVILAPHLVQRYGMTRQNKQ